VAHPLLFLRKEGRLLAPRSLGSGTISFGVVSEGLKEINIAEGGAKPYQLLTHALGKAKRVALARFILRDKESLVLIRASQEGLVLHTMYFHDEVRDFGEIDKDQSAKV
jgi:hypothetical protein